MKAGRWKPGRRGATLVLVTTIGVIVGILAMSMIELGYHARILAVRDVEKVEARCAADAGLAEAFYRMQCALASNWAEWSDAEDLPGPGSGTLPATGAQYSYQISVINSGIKYRIDSTGTYGTGPTRVSRTVHAFVGVGSYWDGLGLEQDLLAQNSAIFGTLHDVGRLSIRSNTTLANTMQFKNNVRVTGDVYSGPGSDPLSVIQTKDTISQTIAGDIGASTEELIWPPVEIPPNLSPSWNLLQGASNVVLDGSTSAKISASSSLPAGRYACYGDLIVSGGSGHPSILTISGHTVIYVQGAFDLRSYGQILLAPGASLELYVGTSLDCGNSGLFEGNTTSENPASIKIFGMSGPAPVPTCTSMILKTKSSVSVGVYAPEADVRIHNGVTSDEAFVGAMVAKSLIIDAGADFLFDTRLADLKIEDVLARFVITYWWED
jgi:hypothetical protein